MKSERPGPLATLPRRTMGRSAADFVVFPGAQTDGGTGKKTQPRATEAILLGTAHFSDV